MYPPSDVEREQFSTVDEKRKPKVFYKPKTVRINFDGTVSELLKSNGLSIDENMRLLKAIETENSSYPQRRYLANKLGGFHWLDCLTKIIKGEEIQSVDAEKYAAAQFGMLILAGSPGLTENTRVDSLDRLQLAIVGFILCIFKLALCANRGVLVIDGVEELIGKAEYLHDEKYYHFTLSIIEWIHDYCNQSPKKIPAIVSTESDKVYGSLKSRAKVFGWNAKFVDLDERVRKPSTRSTLI